MPTTGAEGAAPTNRRRAEPRCAAGRRLETERLVLRPLETADAPALARLLDNWRVAQWLARVPFPYTEADALAWVAETERRWAEGGDRQFSITLKETGAVLGQIGLRLAADEVPVAVEPAAELGYWLGEPFWGRGYASEACRAVVAFGFAALALETIWATYWPGNGRSLRVLEKTGLRRMGSKRQEFVTRGATIEAPLLLLRRSDGIAP